MGCFFDGKIKRIPKLGAIFWFFSLEIKFFGSPFPVSSLVDYLLLSLEIEFFYFASRCKNPNFFSLLFSFPSPFLFSPFSLPYIYTTFLLTKSPYLFQLLCHAHRQQFFFSFFHCQFAFIICLRVENYSLSHLLDFFLCSIRYYHHITPLPIQFQTRHASRSVELCHSYVRRGMFPLPVVLPTTTATHDYHHSWLLLPMSCLLSSDSPIIHLLT